METILRIKQSESSASKFIEITNETQVTVTSPDNRSRKSVQEIFAFTGILDEDTDQRVAFERIALKPVNHIFSGSDSCIMALGTSGAGKTYTVLGNKQEPGIIQSCLALILEIIKNQQRITGLLNTTETHRQSIDMEAASFLESNQKMAQNIDQSWIQQLSQQNQVPLSPDTSYAVFVSFVELYNDKFYDLFEERGKKPIALPLKKSTCSQKRRVSGKFSNSLLIKLIFVGIRKIHIQTTADICRLVDYGRSQRKAFSTVANTSSSRSHAIFTIELRHFIGQNHFKTTELRIADLAGSERVKSTMTSGIRLLEAGAINRSLMILGQCLETLRSERKASAILPSSQNKLTDLLFNQGFDESSRVTMVVNIDACSHYDENVSILRYASHAREMRSLSSISLRNQRSETPDSALVDDLRKEVEEWKSKYMAALQRCEDIEKEVREECAEEMEQMASAMEEHHQDQIDKLIQQGQDHVEKKIEMLRNYVNKTSGL